MKRLLGIVLSAGLVASAGLYGAAASSAAPVAGWKAGTTNFLPPGVHAQRVCANVGIGFARCMSFVLVGDNGKALTSPQVSGLGPADFQDAYNLPSDKNGKGMTVGIVDAFDNPNAEADLQVYRDNFGLPKCTTANGCFKKVDQRGGTDYPEGNTGWGLEIALDLDMVSAICPNCHIVLVESNNNHMQSLGAAVNQAVKQGADAVSNSWGGREWGGYTAKWNHRYFDHDGVAITASSGDAGYGVIYPSSSKFVTAVGGTYLHKDSSKRGWTETAWAGAGSGCSGWNAKPAWQKDKDCDKRTTADVSADASPTSGAAVYDTYGFPGWIVVGGTSESSPIIASVYALAGDKVHYGSRVYKNPDELYDITSGSNGSCGGSYLCTAGKGFDGPTGLGTPNGIGDF
jgi:subtilase family serine protease